MKKIFCKLFDFAAQWSLPFEKSTTIFFAFLVAPALVWGLPAETKGAAFIANEEELALEQDNPRYGKDSLECARNWSMYDEFVRHRAFSYAYEPWSYVFENCPMLTQNIYLHGVTIVRYQYDHETDPAKKAEWLALLMKVFDQRIAYFGNEGFVLGRKAAALYQLQPGNARELFDITQRSIELLGEASEAPVLQINFLAAVQLAEAGQLEEDSLVILFERNMEIVEQNLEQGRDEQFFQGASNIILSLFKPYGSCENLVRIFLPRLEASPADLRLMNQIIGMLESGGCADTELFYLATRQKYGLAPDAESAFLLGRMENSRGNFSEAIRYFEDAASRNAMAEGGSQAVFRSYWLMAEISYRQLRQQVQAREYARKAHEANPTDGRPLILMGEMYAGSAADCGNGEFSTKAAYWAAVDKFQQAVAVAADPAVKERALQMAETYRQYFPNGEEIFFNGFTQGETFRVQCWINETTTIRAR